MNAIGTLDAARQLRCSRRTVQRIAANRQIGTRVGGRFLALTRADVQAIGRELKQKGECNETTTK